MAPLDTDKYLRALREIRLKHAWESSTNPQLSNRPAGEAYMYVVGFQSGLDRAEKLVQEVLKEVEKVFEQ